MNRNSRVHRRAVAGGGRPVATLAVVVFGALWACGDGGATSADARGPDPDAVATDAAFPDASSPDAATRTVKGWVSGRYVTPTGEVTMPVDIRGANIAALIPPDFAVLPGVGQQDGTFAIGGVPNGPYYLRTNGWYLVTAIDNIDYSFDVLGRADAMPATTPTMLVFDVANLNPWQDGDELRMYSAGSGTAAFAMHRDATAGAPAVDDTTLSASTYDLSRAWFEMLIDGSAGDELTLTQLATTSDGTRTYQRLVRAFEPAAFTIANGGSAVLSGAFADVPQTETFAFEWNRPAFDTALRAQVPPFGASFSWPVLAFHTLPEADVRGLYHASAALVRFAPGWTMDASTVGGAWPHGDPYPADWTRAVTAVYYTYRFVQVGAAEPLTVYSYVAVDLDGASVTPSVPIVPLVGPVANTRVNGLDAFASLAGIGLTPSISWDPPAVGTANAYRVIVVRVFDSAGTTTADPIASFDTFDDTSLMIPPGVLESGQFYVFYVIAVSIPGVDREATPNLLSLPAGVAQVVSSLATP